MSFLSYWFLNIELVLILFQLLQVNWPAAPDGGD